MNDEFSDEVRKFLKILEENIDILSNLELDLEEQKEDELECDLDLHHLYDMTEDLAETSKLKRAEFNFMRRNANNST